MGACCHNGDIAAGVGDRITKQVTDKAKQDKQEPEAETVESDKNKTAQDMNHHRRRKQP